MLMCFFCQCVCLSVSVFLLFSVLVGVYDCFYCFVAHAFISRHPLHAVSARRPLLSRVTQGGEYLHNHQDIILK